MASILKIGNHDFQLIRSNRKHISISIKINGDLILRSPLRTSEEELRKFAEAHMEWVDTHLASMQKRMDAAGEIIPYTQAEIDAMFQKALKLIPERVAFYAPLIGVTYGRITIRNQKTKWGSCSGKGNLNFNCLLAEMPLEVLDSVVVHELCHRKEMNHSKAFYHEVYKVFPEYDKWSAWLKEHGNGYMLRMWNP